MHNRFRLLGRSFTTLLGVVAGNFAALGIFALAATVAARTAPPQPQAIEPGTYGIPYNGYAEIDGEPLQGAFTLEVTLRSGEEEVVESTTAQARDGLFAVEIGAGTPLPEWVFAREDVLLSLAVNGTPLGAPQRLYPARAAVHRLERRDVAFTGTTAVGDRLRVRGTSPSSWSPDDPLQVALRDGVGLGGEGLGAAYFAASAFAFDAGSGRGSSLAGVELRLGSEGLAAATPARLDGPLRVAGDVTLDGELDPTSFFLSGGRLVVGSEPGAWLFAEAASLRLRSTYSDEEGVQPAGIAATRSVRFAVDDAAVFEVTETHTEVGAVTVAQGLRFTGATQVIESPNGLSQRGERVECPAGEVMLGLASAGGFERYDIVCTNSEPPAAP